VHFNNSECNILKGQEVVTKGTKSKDKCYQWTPQNYSPKIACLSAKQEDGKMSHKMLQHLYNGHEAESIMVGDVRVTLGIHMPKSV
jgi:hypothetical protein